MRFRALALCIAIFLGVFNNVSAQLTGVACPEYAPYYSKDSINIITFGASTVEGVNGLDFQPLLTTNFLKCYPKKTINIQKYGVGGETTGQGLLRIDNAIENKTGFIVILMGVNDAIQINAGRLSLAQTEKNIRLLISKSLGKKLIPILCTLQNLDDRRSITYRRTNIQIALINALYRKLVQEYDIYLADINAVILRDFTLYQDFIHPNARGNRLISILLFDTVNKIIEARFLQFTVSQNYPNPGREKTLIDIVMPAADKIEFKIYNLQGKLVQTILNEYLNRGKHTIQFNLSMLTPGIYIYRITSTNGLSATKKMIVMR